MAASVNIRTCPSIRAELGFSQHAASSTMERLAQLPCVLLRFGHTHLHVYKLMQFSRTTMWVAHCRHHPWLMIHTHLQTNDHRPSTVAHQVHGDVMCGLRTWIVDLCNFIRHHHAVCLLCLPACHVSCVFSACYNLIRHHHAVCLLFLSKCHVSCVFSACYNLIRRHSMSPICLPASYDAPHVAETSTQYKKTQCRS